MKKLNPTMVFSIGLFCIVLALVGAGLGLLGGKRRVEEEPAPSPEPQAAAEERALPPPESAPAVDEGADEEKLTEILLAQVAGTPERLDAAWLAEFCQYIRDEADLQHYFEAVLERGRAREALFLARYQRRKEVPPSDPYYFIDQTRTGIYNPKKKTRAFLQGRARNFLAQALYREAQRQEGWKNISDDFLVLFFGTSLAVYQALQEMTVESGGDPAPWITETIKTREALIVERYLGIQKHRREARKRLKGTPRSAAPDRYRMDAMGKAVNESLLALGQLYLKAAGEALYKSRQHDYTRRAFMALAMVYQLTKSGEALAALRRVNQIERYNLWQLARASWKQARQAAAAGRRDPAAQKYFMAMRYYLQCLSRLEDSRKRAVLEEFRRLKKDIAAWKAQQGAGAAEDEI